MRDVAIFAEESSLFAAPFLADAIGCNLYVILTQYNNFFGKKARQGIFWEGGKAIKEKHLIIIGYAALKAMVISGDIKKKRFRSVAFIDSESAACRYWKWVDQFITENKIVHYAMPDKDPFIHHPYKPIYQTISVAAQGSYKNQEKPIIAHSPNNSIKARYKGTPFIMDVIKKLKNRHGFEYVNIQGLSMTDCLKLKLKANIFIDQMIYKNPDVPQDRWGGEIIYNGGLGKSGIEAMMLGACVITGGIEPDTSKYFPPPPVVWASYDNFLALLYELITNPDYRIQKAKEQKAWTKNYSTPTFVG